MGDTRKETLALVVLLISLLSNLEEEEVVEEVEDWLKLMNCLL